jgi:hypothetical protein
MIKPKAAAATTAARVRKFDIHFMACVVVVASGCDVRIGDMYIMFSVRLRPVHPTA